VDHVGTQNRIPVDAEAFSLKKAKKGLLFPIVVNASALVFALGATLLFSQLFRADEAEVQTQAAEFASVEGRLIRELRAESQQLLLSKEREIEAVRDQLRALEEEQIAFEESFQERLAEREEELRAQLEAEIEAERARLIAEGIDDEEIERLIEEFEAEREAFYQAQLDAFRAELEAERRELQANVDALRQEYNQRLEELQAERDEIIADFQDREEDLRRELESRTRVIERLQAAAVTDISGAQEELSELSRREERVDAAENQIVGQLDRIRAAILQNELALAAERIEGLLEFLQEDSIVALPELSARRDVDVFLLNQLQEAVEEEIAAEADAEERSLTRELELLNRIRRLSDEADETDEAAGPDGRLQSYTQVIETFPEVSEAHAVLRDVAVETATDERRTEARQEAAANVQTATQSVAIGDYEEAFEAYEAALSATEALAPDASSIIAELLRAGYGAASFVRTGEEDGNARAVAGRAGIDLEADRAAFEREIARRVAARTGELGEEAEAARAIIDQEIAAAVAAREEELRAEIETAEAQAAGLEAIIAEREAELEQEYQAELESLASRVNADLQNLDQRLDELLTFEQQLVAARSAYSEYVSAEEAARAQNPEQALTVARQELNRFLETDAVEDLFGDLGDRIDDLYAATQTAGSSAALEDAVDILADISGQPSVEAARNLLRFEIEDAAGNEDLTRILVAVDEILAERGQ
jgi:hypothetical protein